jgi:hypothetical protein
MSNPSSAGITDEQRLTWVAVKLRVWAVASTTGVKATAHALAELPRV